MPFGEILLCFVGLGLATQLRFAEDSGNPSASDSKALSTGMRLYTLLHFLFVKSLLVALCRNTRSKLVASPLVCFFS